MFEKHTSYNCRHTYVNTDVAVTLVWFSNLFQGMPGVGVTKHIFSVPLFSLFFQDDQNTGYLYDITFIFDRCRRSWAAETPDKYERYWKYLSYTFVKSKFSVTEKLTNGALVTPHPWTPVRAVSGPISALFYPLMTYSQHYYETEWHHICY